MTRLDTPRQWDTLSNACEGMWLLIDTNRHMGLEVSPSEAEDHITDCEICSMIYYR